MNWRKHAACKGLPVDLFMPKRGEVMKIKDARAVCASCSALEKCREFSIQLAQEVDLDGIYGGWTKNERSKAMRAMGLTVRRLGYTSAPVKTMKREVVKIHGTETAYRKHLADKETPCEVCQQKHDDRRYRIAQTRRAKKYVG